MGTYLNPSIFILSRNKEIANYHGDALAVTRMIRSANAGYDAAQEHELR